MKTNKILKTVSGLLLLLMLYFLWKGNGIASSFSGILASVIMFWMERKKRKQTE